MSRFTCACGEVIELLRYPSPHEGWMVGAAEWDAALANAASRLAQGDAASLGQSYPADATLEELSHDLFADAAMAEMRGVVTCGVCGRLWVQAEPGADEYLCYQRCEDRR